MKNFRNIITAFYLVVFFTAWLPVSSQCKNASTAEKGIISVSASEKENDCPLFKVVNPVVLAPESRENSLKRFFKNKNLKIVSGFSTEYSDNGFSFYNFYISFNSFISLSTVRPHLAFGVMLI